MKYQIKIADYSDKSTWDKYVLSHPKGIAYQLFAWSEAVEKAYKFKACYLMALHKNQIKGVLPLVNLRFLFFKNCLISLPYCDAGGPLADNAYIERLLLEHALKFSQSGKLTIRSTRPFADFDPGRTINKQKASMILHLPDSSEQLLAGLKAKVRSQVRKAYKNGLISTMGSINILNDFYSVFSENMRDLGSPVHSKKWIHSILKFYGNRAHVSVVYMPDGKPAAAGIILCHPAAVSVPWASSLRRYNRANPNMMLYWTLLKFASDNGYPVFDFGRSSPGEGTFRFKQQWGASPAGLHWADFFDGPDDLNPLPKISVYNTEKSIKRVVAERVIVKLPVWLSNSIGFQTRKYISL